MSPKHRDSLHIRAIKAVAKKIKRQSGIKHCRALELAAKKFGYLNFYSATRAPDPDYGSWHGRPVLIVVRDELTGQFVSATLSARRQMR